MLGGGFPTPSTPSGTPFQVTTAPAGGWSWFEDPRAITSGLYTYIGYNQGGDLKIAVIKAGAVVNTVTVHAAFEYDDHDTPTLRARSDGKLICFYSKHVGANIYKRISANTLTSDPTLSGGFAAEVSLSGTLGISASTYPSPLYLSSSDGVATLYLFWRETVSGVHGWWYATSPDDGDTWSAFQLVHLHNVVYSKIAPNGTTRVDVACSNHAQDVANTKIYHLYREASAWHKSDGTTITGGVPIAASNMTTVYDGGTDPVWISDIAIDGSGHPIVAFVTWPGAVFSDARYMYAQWTGSAWSVHQIAAGGTWIPDQVEYPPGTFQYAYAGGVILDHVDPQIAYCAIGLGSDLWQIKKFVTADGGASFTTTNISDAISKNVRPVSIRDHNSDFVAVWLYGTYTDYVSYSLGLRGVNA